MLTVSIRTLDLLMANGDIPVVKIGKCVRIREDALAFYVDAVEIRSNMKRRKK